MVLLLSTGSVIVTKCVGSIHNPLKIQLYGLFKGDRNFIPYIKKKRANEDQVTVLLVFKSQTHMGNNSEEFHDILMIITKHSANLLHRPAK